MTQRFLILLALLASALLASAAAAEQLPLDKALEQLRTKGLRLVYSSALIRPEMSASLDLSRQPAREALDQVLAPHGLRAVSGPKQLLLIVKDRRTRSPEVGVVSFVKIVSDKTEDVSSLDDWRASFIKPGMTDEQKALAVWNSVVKFRHQDSPPFEHLAAEGHVHDAIKTFNVYGYCQCCCAASFISQLARYAGLQSRGWGLPTHSLSEVYYDGAWHLLDASLISYYPKADGKLAGIEELCADVAAWYERHPEFKNNYEKLRAFMRKNGWKRGPPLLANCPLFTEHGWFPAGTHGWYSPMQIFSDKNKNFIYEYGCAQGYQVNVQLRAGERLTRNWSNTGLHVNLSNERAPGALTAKVGEHDLAYSVRYGDLAPGRVGNGVHEYELPLSSGAFRLGALSASNLASKSEDNLDPAVHVKDPTHPGLLIVRMPSSYVYLRGELTFDAAVPEGGEVSASISDNHGLSWKELCRLNMSGAQCIDLSSFILRRYDYQLKFELRGKGTGLDSVKVRHDIQHSQRALPALDRGLNTLTFSAGPAEGTTTLEASLGEEPNGKNLHYLDFRPQLLGMGGAPLQILRRSGQITYPISTPGEMKRLRVGAHYRVRDELDYFDVQVSFDGGQSFKTVERLPGPTAGHSHALTYAAIPPGTRRALVRLKGEQFNVACLFGLRIDADYAEPQGGFHPVKITYDWEEDGQARQHVHVARQPRESYTINCVEKPLLKSVVLELAD